jgi:hypothetical protein
MQKQELYDEFEIQKLTLNYQKNLMWFKAYWLPFICVLLTLGIQLWVKNIFLVFIYSIVNTIFGLILYSRYEEMAKSKKELNSKLEHNRRFIEKNAQFETDLNALNFFKT